VLLLVTQHAVRPGGTVSKASANKFEGVLRIVAQGKLFYYAGGMRRLFEPAEEAGPEEQDKDLQDRILHTFRHLYGPGLTGSWTTKAT